jgi:ribosome-associated protein
MESKDMLKKAFELLDDKKGEDIIAFDISKVSSLADFILICSGNSDIHIKALCDYVTESFKKDFGIIPLNIDGYGSSKWVCIDYGQILVNIIGEQERVYYSLENIWGGCPKYTLEDQIG